jgi:hypothetical protein
VAEALTGRVTTAGELERSQAIRPSALTETATTKATPKRETASITPSDEQPA